MGKAETLLSNKGKINEKLMKPFALGWTREVVKRVLTKNPTCDIYYLSPDGKKLRSLREVQAHLTDGLSLDSFSFKREILGVDPNFETVRDAKFRKKNLQKRQKSENESEPKPGPSGLQQPKRRKIKMENADLNLEEENASKDEKNVVTKEVENNGKRKRGAGVNRSLVTKRRKKNALAKVQLLPAERKIFKKVMKRSRILAGKKLLRKATAKAGRPKNEANENTKKEEGESRIRAGRREKQTAGTSAKNNSKRKNFLRSGEKSVSSADTKTEGKGEEPDSEKNETGAQSTSGRTESEDVKLAEVIEESKDLKSIVQKNIVKYRKMREKQKLKWISAQMKKSPGRVVSNSRAESFLKNKSNYLKPLHKGWKRELVYRSNSSKAGLQADVYYIHPSGKKFRSSREIMDNPELIRGLSIDLFTFRKEAVGCGEPLEVIRNARTSYKH